MLPAGTTPRTWRKADKYGIVAVTRARIQDGTAAYFHAVSQHGAEFLKACLDFFLSGFDYHEFFIGFHIGSDGACSHMSLVTQDGISHIVIMGHLHLVEKHHVFELCRVSHDSSPLPRWRFPGKMHSGVLRRLSR